MIELVTNGDGGKKNQQLTQKIHFVNLPSREQVKIEWKWRQGVIKYDIRPVLITWSTELRFGLVTEIKISARA